MTPRISELRHPEVQADINKFLDALGQTRWPYSEPLIAYDLFAGSGWGVAGKRLRIVEYGVENFPAANLTREMNGLHVHGLDVWDEFDRPRPPYRLLIASPPCQTFSPAGNGAGFRALGDVITLIRTKQYLDIPNLRAFGETHDPRTALVLTPLAMIVRDAPMFIALEQVPQVKPVWEAYAVELREMGYSVWVGVLNAEQFGVPQTRKRAFLIARRDGFKALPPTPTHSRFYPTDPTRLDEGVPRWVTMAEALDWGMTDRPMVAFGNSVGRGRGAGGSGGLRAIEREIAAGNWKLRSNYGTGGDPARRGERTEDQPAPTITSKADRNKWQPWDGRPATTVTARPVLSHPGANANRFNGSTKSRNDGERLSVREAALLQTYPEGFEFGGTSIEQYLQVGNAVPPRLAEAVLRTFADKTW